MMEENDVDKRQETRCTCARFSPVTKVCVEDGARSHTHTRASPQILVTLEEMSSSCE